MENKRYILSLSCTDTIGIVSEITKYLAKHNVFILESSQFGDTKAHTFFMRILFEMPLAGLGTIEKDFSEVADKFKMTWNIQDLDFKPRALILVSKPSHCLNDILHRHATKNLQLDIAGIVSNHDTLKHMADWYKFPFHHFPVTAETKETQERQILDLVKELNIDVVILARYMQILSTNFCKELSGKVINIHHSFLPSFKGAKPYHQAYDRGVKIIGATAHYVTEDLDEGPIITQETIHVNHTHSPSQLVSLGQDMECLVLARAIRLHVHKKVFINGNKTIVFKQ